MKCRLYLLALGLLLAACGTKDGPALTAAIEYSGGKTFDNTFGDAALSDVVILAINEGKPVYDTNGDGAGETIAFPESCARPPLLNKGCGFPRQEVQQQISISGLPLGYSWHLELRGRNAAGQNLFTGTSATFVNEAGTTVPPLVIK